MAITGRQNQESDDQGSAGIRVIARAADILRALGKHQDGLTLGEIAQIVGLRKLGATGFVCFDLSRPLRDEILPFLRLGVMRE